MLVTEQCFNDFILLICKKQKNLFKHRVLTSNVNRPLKKHNKQISSSKMAHVMVSSTFISFAFYKTSNQTKCVYHQIVDPRWKKPQFEQPQRMLLYIEFLRTNFGERIRKVFGLLQTFVTTKQSSVRAMVRLQPAFKLVAITTASKSSIHLPYLFGEWMDANVSHRSSNPRVQFLTVAKSFSWCQSNCCSTSVQQKFSLVL